MSKLSILEDLKRRSTRLSDEERKQAIEVLAETLSQRKEVVLALVFGGVTEKDKPVRDIDIAIYTGYKVRPEEWPEYIDKLRTVLEKKLRSALGILKAVDLVLLEYAPSRLRAKALKKGIVLVDRAPGLRGLLLLHAQDEVKALDRLRKTLNVNRL